MVDAYRQLMMPSAPTSTSGAGASSSNGNGSGGGAGGILGGAGGDGSDGWGGGGGGGGGALLEDIGFRLQLLSKELNHNKQLKRSLGVLTECMVAEIAAVSFLLLGQSSMVGLPSPLNPPASLHFSVSIVCIRIYSGCPALQGKAQWQV